MRKRMGIVTLLALVAGMTWHAWPQDVVAQGVPVPAKPMAPAKKSGMAPGAMAQSGNAPTLKVSIAVPEQLGPRDKRGLRSIFLRDKTSTFPVVLENISSKPQKLVFLSCSSPFGGLTFAITDSHGIRYSAHTTVGECTANIMYDVRLEPGETYVLQVDVASSRWQGFPLPPAGRAATVTMSATFTQAFVRNPSGPPPDPELWSGTISSTPRTYMIHNSAY